MKLPELLPGRRDVCDGCKTDSTGAADKETGGIVTVIS
jgi:hypothetical protein